MDLLDEKEVQICIDKIGQKHKKKEKREKETGHQMLLTFF